MVKLAQPPTHTRSHCCASHKQLWDTRLKIASLFLSLAFRQIKQIKIFMRRGRRCSYSFLSTGAVKIETKWKFLVAALNTWHTVIYCLNVDACSLWSCCDFHRHKVSHQHLPLSLPWKTKQGCKLVCFMRCDVSFLISSREKYDCHKSSFFLFFFSFLAKETAIFHTCHGYNGGDRISETMVLRKMTGVKFGLRFAMWKGANTRLISAWLPSFPVLVLGCLNQGEKKN